LLLTSRDPKYTPFAGLIDVGVKLGLELPLFISFKGNRLTMFKHLAEQCGTLSVPLFLFLFVVVILLFSLFVSLLREVIRFYFLLRVVPFSYSRAGPKLPLQQGIALSTHADVSRELMAKRQDRGHYIAAQLVPDKCMVCSLLLVDWFSFSFSRGLFI
jgi:hypothetical protein